MVKEFFEGDAQEISNVPARNPYKNNRVAANNNIQRFLKGNLSTHTEHKLTMKEEKFIEHYLETGDLIESAEFAGYSNRSRQSLASTGKQLLNKGYINDELKYRVELIRSERTATSREILEYFTAVMRGEICDQFGLEAPLSERTKAAQELAKRIIDTEINAEQKGENIFRVVIERPQTLPVLTARDVMEQKKLEVTDEGNDS